MLMKFNLFCQMTNITVHPELLVFFVDLIGAEFVATKSITMSNFFVMSKELK